MYFIDSFIDFKERTKPCTSRVRAIRETIHRAYKRRYDIRDAPLSFSFAKYAVTVAAVAAAATIAAAAAVNQFHLFI